MKKFESKDATFANSKEIPFQRWFPYIEGYSPSFVEDIIDNYCADATVIYEPFAGTGTTIFAADTKNKNTIYSEVNPFLVFLIRCKINVLKMEQNERMILSEQLRKQGDIILKRILRIKPSQKLHEAYKRVFGKSIYFSTTEYDKVLKIKRLIEIESKKGNNYLADLLTVAVLACLLPVSYLKKQGDVRFKTELERQKESKSLEDVLPNKIFEIANDVANLKYNLNNDHHLITNNAKNIGNVDLNGSKISAVITSPPYLNGTNYFRNTKLELWFLGYLKHENDLRKFRDEALTSGINDVKRDYVNNKTVFHSRLFDETMIELKEKAYDNRIPLMAQCYFQEMYHLFQGLRGHLEDGADILIDLGDSIFSGVHIKTDYILIQILEQLGYTIKERVVLRKRISRNGASLSQVLIALKYNLKKCAE